MSLTLALNTALSGLNVNQQALAVLSQNIANANTPGYSRKIANLQSKSLVGNGAGVQIADISRRVDDYLRGSMRTQNSVVGRTSFVTDYTDRIQLMLGNPGSSNSMNSYITYFLNTLRTLSQTPEDATLKAGAVQSGAQLARQMTQLTQGLQDLRFQADQDILSYVSAVNNDLQQIDLLNKTIAQNALLGQPSTELQDQRDLLLSDLAQYMDIQTFTRENGSINISAGGVSLLDDSVYQLSYSAAGSASTFANNGTINPILVYRLGVDGNTVGNGIALTTQAVSTEVASVITSGKIKGALDMRDNKIPQMLAQLDVLAYNLRTEMNALHNAGSGYPGARSYTGSRLVAGGDYSDWTGQVRIAVLGSNGQPISSGYSNQPGGLPPLTIDLSTLNGGYGQGKPTIQSIIDEINQYYGPPQNKVSLGNLSNIRLASDSLRLPGSPAQFSFDLDLENLSSSSSEVFVTGITVLDETNTDITSGSQSLPATFALDATNGLVTNSNNVVTINTTSAHGLVAGDTIFLPDISAAIAPAVDLNGIPLSELNDQYFTISNVTSTSFEITVTSDAGSSGAVASTGATIVPPYSSIAAGQSGRTTADGIIDVSLSGNSTSSFYNISIDVAVKDGNGNLKTSTLTYRVDSGVNNILNQRYAVRSITGQGTLIPPGTSQAAARAILVDANGNELPIVSGQYSLSEQGYLKIIAGNSSHVISIDSLNSEELGDEGGNPPVAATNRGFSHFFGLNNFFIDNDAADPLTGSALSLIVEQRLLDNPDLFSTGTLSLVPPGASGQYNYTYQRTIGDPTNILRMADLALTNIQFAAAGGLGTVTQTLSGYASQIVSTAASTATAAKENDKNAGLLLDGYAARSNAISGVNLDEELANTVIYQNAYGATARVITVARDMFDALLQSV